MKPGDFVMKKRGASHLNKTGIVLRVATNDYNDNKFVIVFCEGKETSWLADYVEVISEGA